MDIIYVAYGRSRMQVFKLNLANSQRMIAQKAISNKIRTPDECSCNSLQLHSSCLITHYEAKINTIPTTVLLLLMAAQSAMAQTKGKKPNSFSPKMLVYENLKNNNVLRHFKQRFVQLDTLIKNPIWVKSPVIELGLNKQHTR